MTDMPKEQLKPCPFCGQQPKYKFQPEREYFNDFWMEMRTNKASHIIDCCSNVATDFKPHHAVRVFEDTEEQAIKSWNTRASQSTPIAQGGEVGEADRDCFVAQPLGKDPEFDAWEKLYDTDKYYLRVLKTKLSSERAMHKAWRKRAEEAEAAAQSGNVQTVTDRVLFYNGGSDGCNAYLYGEGGLVEALWLAMFGGEKDELHKDEVEGIAEVLEVDGYYDFEDGKLYIGRIVKEQP